MDPELVRGYADQLWTALKEGAQSLLGATTIKDLQLWVIRLPMREGGWGWVSVKQNLHLRHVGSAGVVGKYLNVVMVTNPEMKHLLEQLRLTQSVIWLMMAISKVAALHAQRI